jgi:hypothetical protein
MSNYETTHFVDTEQPVWNYSLFTQGDIQAFQQGTHSTLYHLFGNKQIVFGRRMQRLYLSKAISMIGVTKHIH